MIWQGNRKVFGSQIGGIKETQEMLDYSIANNIYPEVEIIPQRQLPLKTLTKTYWTEK